MKRIPDDLPDNVQELLQLTDRIWCVSFKDGPYFNDPGVVGWELWNADNPEPVITIMSPSNYEEFAEAIRKLLTI